MSFWKKILKSKKQTTSENHFLKQKEEHIDYYANSWVDSEIPNIERSITDLIYQTDLKEDTINKFLNFISDFGDSGWDIKGEMNFPGPFYTGETDTCGTGIIESPNNVIFDEYSAEFVMIQPRNRAELLGIWNAGAVEVFGGYHCDGNKYWTVQLVKNWWANRHDIFEHLRNDKLIKSNCNQEKRYEHYLRNEAENDLRRYCFFLENGIYPQNEKLPEIM